MTTYQQFVAKWKGCQDCELHIQRSRICLARGTVPCSILLVGEAPGVSEDTLGTCFIGPAGKLLDRIVERAIPKEVTWCMCNLVCCFPQEAKETANHAPPDDAIKACQNRLRDFILICKPKLVVCVGSLATRWVHVEPHRTKLGLADVRIIDVIHPAALLRASVAQQGLMVQRCVVTISNAVEELAEA